MRGEDIRTARKSRGWSVPVLIAALNSSAERDGVRLMNPTSLKVAISRWENNHAKPDALHSRLLARVLHLPYAGDPVEAGGVYQRDAVAAITVMGALTESDSQNDPALARASTIGSFGAAQVVTGYLFGQSPALVFPDEPPIGFAAAERIRSTVAAMMSMDFQKGGGHTRRVLLRFFRSQVLPELDSVRPGVARRELFSAAAEVAQLLAWSAYDIGRHGVAMRYFIQGLKLAEEAGDHRMGARLLANMSHQANFMGSYSDAVMYARAAQSALRGHGTPSVDAMCVMMEARGLANLNDKKGTAAAINRAEQFHERRHGDEPVWIGYYDIAELAGDASHCWRDLKIAGHTRSFVASALTDETPPRTRAFVQMVAAEGSLFAGDLEEAGALAAAAVVNGGSLRSGRYLRYLADFYHGLPTAAVGHRAVAEFVDLMHTHHPAIVARR